MIVKLRNLRRNTGQGHPLSRGCYTATKAQCSNRAGQARRYHPPMQSTDTAPFRERSACAPASTGHGHGLRIAACIFMLVFFVRAGGLVLHDPLIGLANNYDMIRVQGCIDAYPVRDAQIHPEEGSWQAPIPRYAFRDGYEPGCFASSESLLALAMLPGLRLADAVSSHQGFPLRLVGVVKWLLLSLVCLVPVLLLFRQGAWAAGAMAAGLAAVLAADPAVTLYFNTFYAEYAALLFAWLAVGVLFVDLHATESRWLRDVLLFIGIFGACTAKLQHVAFGLWVLLPLLALRLGRGHIIRNRTLVLVAVSAIAGLALQAWNLDRDLTATISRANKTNTFLGAVLGSSSSPSNTTALLGLPAACAEHAGKDWFSPDVEQAHPCPEVFDVSRLALANVVLHEPATIFAVLVRGIDEARPWIPPVLGKIEGEVQGEVPAYFPSLSTAIAALPRPLWLAVFLLPLALAPVFAFWPGGDGPSVAVRGLLVFLGSFPTLTLATVVFGDGFADVPKQFHLGMTSLLAFYLVASGWWVANVYSRRCQRNASVAVKPGVV